MFVFMCVIIYTYMYICIYIYMYKYVCMYVCTYVYIYIHIYICIYTYIYAYICICMYICIYTYMYILCACIYKYVCISHSDILYFHLKLSIFHYDLNGRYHNYNLVTLWLNAATYGLLHSSSLIKNILISSSKLSCLNVYP
jgi:hypothetical protein